jgi:hypothetical protein
MSVFKFEFNLNNSDEHNRESVAAVKRREQEVETRVRPNEKLDRILFLRSDYRPDLVPVPRACTRSETRSGFS